MLEKILIWLRSVDTILLILFSMVIVLSVGVCVIGTSSMSKNVHLQRDSIARFSSLAVDSVITDVIIINPVVEVPVVEYQDID